MNGKSKRLAYIALFAALTLVLGYMEAMIPLPVAVPGVKLGLANVTVLIALYLMGPRWAGAVLVLKVIVTSLIIGAPSMMIYSAAGSVLAFVGMLAIWKIGAFNILVASVVAALLHNLGQLGVAALIMQTPAIFLNLPVMIVAACITGSVTGAVAAGVLKALPPLQRTGAVAAKGGTATTVGSAATTD